MLSTARFRLKTWITAGAGAAVVVAGLLGAFGSLHEPPARFSPGSPIETGQWVVKPLRAYVGVNGIYDVPLKPGRKALVYEVEMTNRTAESTKDYFSLFRPVQPLGEPPEQPFVVLTRDSTLSPELHPGMRERMAYVWPIEEAARPPAILSLAINTQTYKPRDNLYGTPGWYDQRVLGTVDLPVGAVPDAPNAKP